MHSQNVVIGSSAERVWACEYETRDCLHLPQVMLFLQSSISELFVWKGGRLTERKEDLIPRHSCERWRV